MPETGLGSHRRVLRRLKDVMTGPGTAQERLDRLVQVVAAELVAEVCSVYVMRAGEVLELFATEGLKPEAVRRTRLRISEGLIGVIAASAKPLNLPDAQGHPDFSYRPETGEEIYSSMLGVPVVRGGRVMGVIAIQNRAKRTYADEELDALEFIAVLLAELIAGGDLIDASEMVPVIGNQMLPERFAGLPINGGLAMGHARVHRQRLSMTEMFAEDIAGEQRRLDAALRNMYSALDDMMDTADFADAAEPRDVLITYRQFAEDRGWIRRIREAIDSGLAAEAAVQAVQSNNQVRMARVSDPYIAERLQDLEDLTDRLLQHLVGDQQADGAVLPGNGNGDIILVARNMGPAQLLDYAQTRLKGLVLEEGSATSHVSIVAKALNIPVIGQVDGILSQVDDGDFVVIDADNSQVFLRPGEDVQLMFAETERTRDARRRAYEADRDKPAVSRDRVQIGLQVNAGLLVDVQSMAEIGADGVGLYRTEIPFMVRSEFPSVSVQTNLYTAIFDAAADRPVTFRTLDIGGDKHLPYFPEGDDENPSMGWRSIRIVLDRPLLLRRQLRALLSAAAGHRLRIMFPMIAEVAEFRRAREILDKEVDRAKRMGLTPPSAIDVGVMLEVPSLIWQLDTLLPEIDFLSVGSNDLFQFMFASDRGNPLLTDRYDPLSPGLLSMLRDVAARCRAQGVEACVCGEMAGNPLDAMALIGAGYRVLSMSPPSTGAVRSMIRSLHVSDLTAYMETLYSTGHHSLREHLRAFSRDRGVEIP